MTRKSRAKYPPEEARRRQLAGLRAGGRPWTPEEDAIIAAEYGRYGAGTRLAGRLDRTVQAIGKRARMLGANKGRAVGVRWTPERDAIIRRWCDLATTDELAAMIGTTPVAVARRRAELRIPRREIALERAAENLRAIRRLRILLAHAKGLLTIDEAALALGVKPVEAHRLVIREAVAGAGLTGETDARRKERIS